MPFQNPVIQTCKHGGVKRKIVLCRFCRLYVFSDCALHLDLSKCKITSQKLYR